MPETGFLVSEQRIFGVAQLCNDFMIKSHLKTSNGESTGRVFLRYARHPTVKSSVTSVISSVANLCAHLEILIPYSLLPTPHSRF